MSRSEFEKQLRGFLDQIPFQPFFIEHNNGEQILVTNRQAMSYLSGASALFFDPDESMHFIDCDNVKRIVAASPAGTL